MTIRTYEVSDLIKTNCLVSIPTTMPPRSKKDKVATQEMLEKYGANSTQAAVIVSLFNPNNPLLKEIDKVKGLLRNTHTSLTQPWFDEGPRIITTRGYGAYKVKVEDLIAQFYAAVEAFIRDYDNILLDAQANLHGLYRPENYPTAEAIRQLFSAKLVTDVIPDRADIRLDIDEDRMAKLVEDIRREEHNRVDNVFANIQQTIVKEVTEMIEALDRHGVKLKDGARAQGFRDTLVPRIAKMVDMIKMTNITNDPKVEELRDRIYSKLAMHDCEALREDDVLREEVKQDATEILNDLDSYFGAKD